MTRRTLLAGAAGAVWASAEERSPSLAVTMDDVNWRQLADPMRTNSRLLEVMRELKIRIALFVIGRNAEDETGRRIVQSWKDEGHLIGNHTYSHRNYHALTFEEFSADAAHAGEVLSTYLGEARLFRFPMLKEGDTARKRDLMRDFLAAKGYRNGHVTIDASDWYYDSRLRKRLERDPGFDVTRFRQPYFDHLWERARFYDDLAGKVLGRRVPHTLLVHYNLLNSLFLPGVLRGFKERGWRIVDAQEAYGDPVYLRGPKIVPAGESLVWAMAKETGKFDGVLRYPGEDETYEKAKLDRLGL